MRPMTKSHTLFITTLAFLQQVLTTSRSYLSLGTFCVVSVEPLLQASNDTTMILVRWFVVQRPESRCKTQNYETLWCGIRKISTLKRSQCSH